MRNSIKQGWDEAIFEKWSGKDQKKFDATYRAWCEKTGNVSHFKRMMDKRRNRKTQSLSKA